jgi:hypothetical protein
MRANLGAVSKFKRRSETKDEGIHQHRVDCEKHERSRKLRLDHQASSIPSSATGTRLKFAAIGVVGNPTACQSRT